MSGEEVKVQRKPTQGPRKIETSLYHVIDGHYCWAFKVDESHWTAVKTGSVPFDSDYATLPNGSKPIRGSRFVCGTCGFILNAQNLIENKVKLFHTLRGDN